jgi:hypothetical protein
VESVEIEGIQREPARYGGDEVSIVIVSRFRLNTAGRVQLKNLAESADQRFIFHHP